MSINLEIFTAKEHRLRGTCHKERVIELEAQGKDDPESVTIELNPDEAREMARWLNMQANREAR